MSRLSARYLAATNCPTGVQLELVSRLAAIDELIAGGQATLSMLERERMQLITRLRLAGYRASAAEVPPLPTSGGHTLL